MNDSYQTTDNERELQAIEARIARRAYERDVLQPRLAAEEAQRARDAERAERRQRAYARAEHAVTDWWPGVVVSRDTAALQRLVVDLALEDPAITIEWLKPLTRSLALVGANNALAFCEAPTAIVCPPIRDVEAVLDALHEIGHVRTAKRGQRRLQDEVAAWRWARAHAPVWNGRTQAHMVESLNTYARAATHTEIRDVLAIEQVCSGDEYRRERIRRVELEIAGRQAHDQAILATNPLCADCHRAPASIVVGADRPICAACSAAAIRQAHAREIADQRTRYAAKRHGLGEPCYRCRDREATGRFSRDGALHPLCASCQTHWHPSKRDVLAMRMRTALLQ